MPEPRTAQQQTTRLLSLIMVVLGVAIIVRTIVAGGSPISAGLVLGVLFVAAGAGRIYVARSR